MKIYEKNFLANKILKLIFIIDRSVSNIVNLKNIQSD